MFGIPLVRIHRATIRDVAYRCSGDFSQCKQTKYNMALPGLSDRAISQMLLADINEMERAVAAAPGMHGRIWYDQGLAFDEAYQILQEHV